MSSSSSLSPESSALASLTIRAAGPSNDGGTNAPTLPPSVAAFLETVLDDALGAGASDIHFEPQAHRFRVRLRVDGRLHERGDVPPSLRDMLPTRLKVLAHLDIAEKRLPQDGRLVWRHAGGALECRVSTLPTLHGEKLVVRLLDAAKVPLELNTLGYLPQQQAALTEAIARPCGLVLVTGPTGSGKTVSLYSCLRQLNTTERNIATVEDPVEIRMSGVNQVNVNPRAGLSFAVALRAFLRQDPDVLMIGEIRDAETAAVAIQAAQTGHLVLASVHANDAPSTVARLFDLGVAPFNLAACLRLVSAQRLVRKRCPARCQTAHDNRHVADSMPYEANAQRLELAWPMHTKDASETLTSCRHCHGSGACGRTGIYEVMPVSHAMARVIANGCPPHDIAAQASAEGIMTLREAGLARWEQRDVWRDDVLSATLS